MSRIGIVSYYHNINYGSALQACALQMAIRKLGYECAHIRRDTTKTSIQKLRELLTKPHLVAKRKLSYYYKKASSRKSHLRRKRFQEFVHENIRESEVGYKPDQLSLCEDTYDAFICGSDQIWAPNQFDEWFYLSFVSNKFKKIAYAPSIGLPSIPENLRDRVSQLIKNIAYLSIREKQGADLVKDLTGLEIPVVLDPTLLINKKDWLAIAQGSLRPQKPYILCLFLGDNPSHRKTAESLAAGNNLNLAVLPFRSTDYGWGDHTISDAGPAEFIDLINNAAVVLTDSFHGAAFSLNLNKPFFVFMRFTDNHPICQNSRIINLLNTFSLQTRLISSDDPQQVPDVPMDFACINDVLFSERARSLQYLKSSIESSLLESQKKRCA